MELQLALSLSSSSSSSCTTKFDLNYDNVDGKNMEMEDLKRRKLCVINDDDHEQLGGFHVPQTLPLLFCDKRNQEHDDVDVDLDLDDDHVNEAQSYFIFKNHKNNGGEENGMVGWPPVKSSRKKISHGGSKSKSMYVKVQMEGDGITRKIDLNLHHSYITLIHTLAHMFQKCNEDVQLAYQDKEGDWLLAGDVPWGLFTESVQRLKLIKSNDR